MIRTVEAVIDERGRVRLIEPVELGGERRALVTILEEEPSCIPMRRPCSLRRRWRRTGIGRRRTPRGPICSRRGSPRAVSLLRPVSLEAVTGGSTGS